MDACACVPTKKPSSRTVYAPQQTDIRLLCTSDRPNSKKLPKIKLIEALINSNLFLLKRYIFLNMAVPGHTPSPILSVQTRDILKHTHRNS